MPKQLVIVGNGQMAELFFSHFTYDTDYRVAGFAVDRAFMSSDRLLRRRPGERPIASSK